MPVLYSRYNRADIYKKEKKKEKRRERKSKKKPRSIMSVLQMDAIREAGQS